LHFSPVMIPYRALGWRAIGSELVAFAMTAASLPIRALLQETSLDACAPHATPVVLVHGILGSPTNFLLFRWHLRSRGIRNVATFSYRPGIDVPELARRLADRVDTVRRAAGVEQVDLIGHSLGGVIARYLAETQSPRRVRRLVTLGAPRFTNRMAPQELAIFGAADPLVSSPDARHGRSGRIRVVADCGHMGLLYHPVALAAAARHLRYPAAARAPGARSAVG
jgi:pimeloyl-ACP methyl ester carboxylesterase